MFEPLPSQFSFPEAEQRVLEFWEQHDIFQKSLDIRRGAPRFVFYEGPPTANGLPHPGHCLTRAIKDLFPRYKTMCGYLVERKAGWDTHGLPVEVEVCKELGIHTKEEIEAYGVEKFVQRCIESVFRYVGEWEQMTRRLGFWVNLEEAYVTFHQSYVESVWWSLKTLFERGLLYQGHKVVWWWAQGGTALSAGEVGEGYRTVQDPSVYVRFPLAAEGVEGSRGHGAEGTGPRMLPHLAPGLRGPFDPARVSLLVWTTTPWTLISNHFCAVGPDIDYALVHDKTTDEYLYIAAALVPDVAGKVKHDLETVGVCKGADLVGLRYVPPFDCYHRTMKGQSARRKDGGSEVVAWRVVAADFVALDTGTGLVHQAPAYGEVDFNLLQAERQRFADFDAIPLINAVAPDGTFTDEAPPAYRGRWVKDCDAEIMRELKDRGILYHQETIEHEYPFCPRAEDDPLIQYARKSWFVRTSQFKEEFLKNNAGITWLPEHIQEGRFGDFLRNNVDWALSRERYWGTPLPIWVCEKTGKMEAVGSYAELLAKPGVQGMEVWEQAKAANPDLPEHLKVHKPYIDAITYDSPFANDEPGAQATGSGAEGGAGVSPVTTGGTPVPPRKARMRRVPEVIDCWWDAGSMPFAQWGFPHAPGSIDTFVERFPCDFISEALDQTRGWFYGLLAISTLLFSKAAGDELRRCEAPEIAEALTVEPEFENLPNVVVATHDGGPERFVFLERAYPHPYKACIVLGLMMGEDGLKMSKRKKNYREPGYIFDHYGADAMRWFLFSGQTPWTSVRFQEQNIRDAQREFLVRLYNVFSFFNIYANIDGFAVEGTGNGERGTGNGAKGTAWRPVAERGELDRWIVSELHRTIRFVRESMDRFENYPAAGRINDFVDALSNWYVRRSRERFWRPVQGEGNGERGTENREEETKGGAGVRAPAHSHVPTSPRPHVPTSPPSPADQDKWDAYNTLYEVLLTLSKLIAPFTPFFAETMYQNLVGSREQGTRNTETGLADAVPLPVPGSPFPCSVHLCDYPVADEALIDERLAAEMDLVREVVSLGRAARTAAKLKVRQPLALAEIILARPEHAEWLTTHSDLIADELNIKRVELSTEAEQYVTYQVKPDFKVIGPKFGKLAPRVAAALAKADAAEVRRAMTTTGRFTLEVDGEATTLVEQDVEVRLEAKPGWSAAQGRAGVVVVKTELTDELRDEGLCREVIHLVQALRKTRELPYEARITLFVRGSEKLVAVVRRFAATIQNECLASSITWAAPPDDAATQAAKIDGHDVTVGIVAG
ncbi:MAG: class I tRNA ligase family protein [Planctomycetota bacterium]